MLESFGCSPNYPEPVLIDMMRMAARGVRCEYFELDPVVDEDGWAKRTETHDFVLCCEWFICQECNSAECFCCCDGRDDDVRTVEDLEFEGADQMFDDHGLFQWGDWG